MLKRLYIEPTSNCNFNCKMCFRHTWFDEKFTDMTWEMFEQIIEGIPFGVETIFFGGMGEPLYHRDILRMVEVCKAKGYRVELLTNGSLLSEEMCGKLMDLNLNKLWVSLDDIIIPNNALYKEKEAEREDVDEATSELGHPSARRVLANLKKFNHMRYARKSTMELGVTFVVSKDNVTQLKNIPYFVDAYLVNEVHVSNIYPADSADLENALYNRTLAMSIGSDKFGLTRPKVKIPYMDFDDEKVQEGLNGMFSKMNFNLYVGDTYVPRQSQYCRFVEEGMCFVRSDGNVSPCMALLHNGTTAVMETERKVHHHSFGNVGEQALEEIWNSDEYTEFRERVKSFAFSPCINCGHCDYPASNEEDCFGNEAPTCGACLWSEGIMSCP